MAQNTATMSNSSEFRSVIQVDQDIAFVLDSRDIEFSTVVNNNKSIGISRKTYSKKQPVVFDATVPALENKMNGNSNITSRNRKAILKISPKCSSAVQKTTKEFRRKRPLDKETTASETPVPRKMRKKEILSTRINGGIIDKSRQRNSPSLRVPSPDSDIEILDVIEQGSSRATKRNSSYSFNGRERNREKLNDFEKKKNSKSLPSIMKPCYPSSDDIPISEADIAPFIPSNSVIPDTGKSETNQNVLNSQSVNKWMLSTAISEVSHLQNGETNCAKESDKKISDNTNLFFSQTEEVTVGKRKRPPKRELKSLYANLNEISWAKEKGFLQMLSNTDHRHSERITAKAVDTGKNLRRLKAGSGKKLSVLSNRQKKASSKNSAKLVLKRAKYGRPKPKVVLKKNLKSKQSVNKICKRGTKLNVKPLKKISVRGKNVPRKVIIKPKTLDKKKQVSPPSNKIPKNTGTSNIKMEKTLQHDSKSNLPSALKKLVETNTISQVLPESSSSSKVMKKFEYSNEVKIFKKKISDSKVYSKLKVDVEPLHNTEMWNSNFCEAFSRYVMDQSSTQVDTKNKDSLKAMFEELLESWFNNQPDNPKLPKKKKPEEETLRSSVRQSECAFRYKEIVVKKHDSYMQFILVPNAVKQNSLSIEAMKELKDAFLLAKKDPNCRAVLLNSSGTFFCTGIDLSQLIGSNKKQTAEEMAATIKDLVLTLSSFTKPVVAAVNGIAVGFGVTLLTMCDVVLASDKATFCIPATRLGYLPEGAITLTLPQVVGSTVATELLLYGRRLTADQALRHGLVSEVLWHSNLMNEVVPRIQVIVSQPLQVMEATKTMVRCHLWDKLKFHMEREWRLLPPLWLDAQCQSNIKKALQTGWLYD